MEAILGFIGSYWWLGFIVAGPIVGIVGSARGWWEKQEELSHRRKLEIIEAKARAKAISGSEDLDPERIAHADAADRSARVQRLMDTHDDVARRWLDYELDPAKLIAFPTMSDGREPLTAAFLRAKKAADSARPSSAKARIDAEAYAEYRDAVHDCEAAFDVAEQEARRVRDTGFTESERQRLSRAQQLLKVAVDQSATADERQLAYRRVRDELDGLIVLSEAAVVNLEKKVAPEIER
ncbi:hypothetical protein [Microbacterium halophytorum]|uniref:hypothetical protein n=1 Tax=Microbacterium halophytorum TaxID=2067568 RepID=UPI000CFCEF74|nr:hypothetical protein [Microbacterium halophytorum]